MKWKKTSALLLAVHCVRLCLSAVTCHRRLMVRRIAVRQRPRTCVNVFEAVSLVTICLRWSSCQLRFLSLIRYLLSLPVHYSHMTRAATSQDRFILRMCWHVFLFSVFLFLPSELSVYLCVSVSDEICVNAPRANGTVVFFLKFMNQGILLESTPLWNTNAFVFCLTVSQHLQWC